MQFLLIFKAKNGCSCENNQQMCEDVNNHWKQCNSKRNYLYIT